MILRDYQQTLFESIHAAFRRGVKNPLVVSPTGSGKTVLFSYIANRVQGAGKRVMILVHRKELVTQTSRTFAAFNIPHGIIQTGATPAPHHNAQIAMVQTLARRLDKYAAPDLIIIDECHHVAAGQYRQIIAAFPSAHVIGVTATPQRLDGKGLSDFFSEIIIGPSVQWLMDEGFLSAPKYYAPPIKADFSGVKKRGGDFATDQAAAAMDKATITGDAVNHYARICPGMPAIAFCVTVAHAKHVADQFNSAGIPSATIHAGMNNDERRDIVANLANGKISVMTSCDIVSEGFDVPVVGAAILLRPTTSLGLHLQQIGRVLRSSPGKTHSVILDHVGNLLRHGLAEDEREWSLDGVAKAAKKSESLGLKQCKQCFCLHKPSPICPECGYSYPVPPARQLSYIEANLEEFKRKPIAEVLKECKTREDLKMIAKARGYKPGFVYYKAKELGIS